MKLDEAIKHCEEAAYQKDMQSGFDTDNERYAMTDNERAECKECAAEQRQLAEWLKELKTLKSGAGWFPVSERLPKERGNYLVTTQKGYVTIALWFENVKSWSEITAWRPLPKPYKGREMAKDDIISGLKMTINLALFDPTTGETKTKHMLNDTDRTTVEACEGAIELLSNATKEEYNI